MQQISLFEYLEQENTKDVPVVFHKGNILYFVRRADVERCTVCDEKPWLIHNNTSRGYRILFENGCYGVIKNESLNTEVFFRKEDANRVAEDNACSCDMIRADEMHLQLLENYQSQRDCDGYTLRSYMADMGNGYLYIKDFMTYVHIIRDTPKARKAYHEKIMEEKKHIAICESHTIPQAINMYKCRNDGEWVYAEAKYMY